jgi:hypothetical protein
MTRTPGLSEAMFAAVSLEFIKNLNPYRHSLPYRFRPAGLAQWKPARA